MSTPIVKSAFDELVASTAGDKAFLSELVDTYLADSPKLLIQMHTALEGKDTDAFRRAAHTLKSTSANFGALTLSELAKELEMMAKAGTLDGAAEKLPCVEEEFRKTQEELQRLVGQVGSTG